MIYGIVFEAQKDEIKAYCWGQGCGKAQIGALDVGPFHLILCHELQCVHADQEMDEPMGDWDGKSVYLRKLKSKNDRI